MQPKNKIKFVGLILFFVVIIFLAIYLNFFNFFDPELIRDKIEVYGSSAPIVYILLYVIATMFFLPATPVTIAGGFLFGTLIGGAYALTGAIIGACLAFFIARSLGRGFVKELIETNFEKINDFDEKIAEHGFITVLFMRLMPIFPFNGNNLVLGVTKIKFRDYLIASIIGISAWVFVLAFLGNSIFELNIVKIAISAGVFISFIIALPLYRHFKKKKGRRK